MVTPLPNGSLTVGLEVYVGHSLAHSGNVPVIYNPYRMHILLQFDVVFDEKYITVGIKALIHQY
jgi:hypothetical protein